MRRIHSVFLCFFAIQLLAPACKVKREKYATGIQAAEVAKPESISYELSANAEGESKDFGLTETASYPGSSPLATVNYEQFLAAEKHKSVVLDILPNGKMIDASTGTIWGESCIAVALFDKFSEAAVRSFAFISNLKKEWSPVDELGPELVVFEYCEEEASLGFNFKKMDDAGLFREALNARGLELTELASLGMFRVGKGVGKLSTSLIGSEAPSGSARGLGEGAGPASPRVPRSPSPEGAAAEPRARSEIEDARARTPEAVGGTRVPDTVSGSRAGDAADVKTFKDFDDLPLDKRWAGNEAEAVRYRELIAANRLEKKERLGKLYSSTYKVEIDGRPYVLREQSIETVFGGLEGAQNQRLRYLVQNEFARLNPQSGFVRTHLSFVDVDPKTGGQRLISITEFRDGGDAAKGFVSKEVTGETKRQMVNNLLGQLQKYQEGYPVTIQGDAYQLIFSHGSIRPANVVLDKEGTRAAFIGFGESSRAILWSKKTGKFRELKAEIGSNGEIQQVAKPLTLDKALLGKVPEFTSPEIAAIKLDTVKSYKDTDAASVLMGEDIHAVNVTSFYTKYGEFPYELKEDFSRTFKSRLEEIFKYVEPRGFSGNPQRRLLKFDELKDKEADIKAIKQASLSTVSRRHVQLAYIFK